MDSTPTDAIDRSIQSALCRYVAVRPVIKSNGATELLCGLCGELLTRFELQFKAHRVDVFSCSVCGWHTRRIDGLLATRHDLLDITSEKCHSDRGAEAVSWYRSGGVFSLAER